MGGHAFMWHHTPRMPNNVYQHVRDEVISRLQSRFSTVIVPRSVPGKTDHGDIDVCVGGPLDCKLLSNEDLADLIGAIEFNDVADKEWTYFVVPWPDAFKHDLPPRPLDFAQTRWTRNQDTDDADAIQVDIQQYKEPILAQWNAYWISYGCLRRIMNAFLRDFGLHHQLRPENKHDGLFLRIEELEDAVDEGYLAVKDGKKWCHVRLTVDPSAVFRFAGMLEDGQEWNQFDFETEEDFAAFICTKNRFFHPGRLEHYVLQYEDEFGRYGNAEAADKYLAFFAYLVKDYIPSNQQSLKPGAVAHLSRAEVEKEVCDFFTGSAKEIGTKIQTGRAMYLPRRFWMNLDTQLRLFIHPEVVYDLSVKRYGRIVTFLLVSGTWLKSLARRGPSRTQPVWTTPLSAVDEAKLKGLVNTRIGLVVRAVKRKTIRFDPAISGQPCPPEYDLWTAGDFGELLALCVRNRQLLEQEQKELEVRNWLDSLERKGKLKTPRAH